MILALLAAVSAPALATCPSDVVIHDQLTCSSDITGQVDHTADSYLGGDCETGDCYTCGDPWQNEPQRAPEAVYTFECQLEGTVALLITDLPCDLDMYVLDDSCDPGAGCLYGSTASYAVDDTVEFTCSPGELYYIVIEAYGTDHFDNASGVCTDDGTVDGAVYSPTYTLSFDVSASTGCAEDCDNGEDDDLDGVFDCLDSDCWAEPLCCDTDGDGEFAVGDCGGDDCDDTDASVYTTATETADGIDNDCDGVIDNGTDDYDDDGDGWTENDGDCDDDDDSVYPGAEDIPGDGIDQDCDGADATEETGDGGADGGGEDGGADGGGNTDGNGDDHPEGEGSVSTSADADEKTCGCDATGGGLSGLVLILAGLGAARRRREG